MGNLVHTRINKKLLVDQCQRLVSTKLKKNIIRTKMNVEKIVSCFFFCYKLALNVKLILSSH